MAVHDQIGTRGGAVQVLVAKNLSYIGTTQRSFLLNFIDAENTCETKIVKILSQRVENRISFRAFSRVFQWEHHLVVCTLISSYAVMIIHVLKGDFHQKRCKLFVKLN